MSAPLSLVIFDLDGTLVDSVAGIHECISLSLDHHDLPPVTLEFVKEGIGLGLVEAWARIHPEGSTADHQRLTDTYKEVFLARRAAGGDQDPLFPGVKEGLAQLEGAGHILGIATNKGRPGVHHVLDLHGIGKHFVAIRSAHDGPAKPHPGAIHDVLSKTGAEARHTVFVGDTETDMMTAKNAGVPGVGVAWGYHSADRLRDAGAAGVVESFGDLASLVGELTSV